MCDSAIDHTRVRLGTVLLKFFAHDNVDSVMHDKIYLDTSGNVKSVQDDSALVDKLDKLLADDGGPGIDDL